MLHDWHACSYMQTCPKSAPKHQGIKVWYTSPTHRHQALSTITSCCCDQYLEACKLKNFIALFLPTAEPLIDVAV